jgi:hypothetical protein
MSHWRMMKKLGLTGTRPQPRKGKKEPAVPTKRRAAAEESENGDEDADEDEPETPTKKAKKST